MLQCHELSMVGRLIGHGHEDPVSLWEDAFDSTHHAVGIEDENIIGDLCTQLFNELWKLGLLECGKILRRMKSSPSLWEIMLCSGSVRRCSCL